jgi:hypothetical protein
MVRYVLLRPRRPEQYGQDVEASSAKARQQLTDERYLKMKQFENLPLQQGSLARMQFGILLLQQGNSRRMHAAW